jgi:hypothetical protein
LSLTRYFAERVHELFKEFPFVFIARPSETCFSDFLQIANTASTPLFRIFRGDEAQGNGIYAVMWFNPGFIIAIFNHHLGKVKKFGRLTLPKPQEEAYVLNRDQ